VNRVCVVRTGATGDLIATFPVLSRLREACSELVVVAPVRVRPLAPGVDRWVDAEGPEASRLLSGRADLGDVEVGIAYTAGAAGGLRASGVRRVIQGAPRPPPGVPIHDHLWRPLVELGLGSRDRDPRITPFDSDVSSMKLRLSAAGLRRPTVIAPGSGGASKRWPLHRWREVAEALGDGVLWVGGPVEADEPGWGTPRWDDLDLRGLCALAACAGAWLGPDAGPGHLAAACGARVGVVFTGATDPANWAPPGAEVFGPDVLVDDVVAWARHVLPPTL
jgi:ADP-heptose:LPS heptosyltransferase